MVMLTLFVPVQLHGNVYASSVALFFLIEPLSYFHFGQMKWKQLLIKVTRNYKRIKVAQVEAMPEFGPDN